MKHCVIQIVSHNILHFLNVATVDLSLVANIRMSPHIDCPGDTFSYVCSINSNTEMLHLTWTVTYPGVKPVNVTYDVNSPINEQGSLTADVTTSLQEIRQGDIQSSLVVTVHNASMNQTLIECSIAPNLDSRIETLVVNTSGMCVYEFVSSANWLSERSE